MASLVILLGAAVTIATSAPANPTLRSIVTLGLEAGTSTHFVLRLSRPAAHHADRVELFLRGSGETAGALVLTADDSELEPAGPGPASVAPFASLSFGDVEALCPGESDCDIGLAVAIDAPDGTFQVQVEARVMRGADTRFLFPEDRSFPEGSTADLVVE